MNMHDATEQAYKNGYEDGVTGFADLLKAKAETSEDGTLWVSVKEIEKTKKELVGDK